MITAHEARELSSSTPQERVDMIEPLIREAATAKEHKVVLDDSFWVNEGYNGTADYKNACKILEGLGYKVEFFYDDREFVNMYTIVMW